MEHGAITVAKSLEVFHTTDQATAQENYSQATLTLPWPWQHYS